MGALVTAGQAAAALADFPADAGAAASLIDRASAAVEGWCECGLSYGPYAEPHRPGRARRLTLRARPVSRVLRLAAGYADVLSITCTDAAAARATAEVYRGVLTLTSVRAGAPTPPALTLASFATAGDLAAAISATPGWSATSARPGWPVSDLAPPLGAVSALGGAATLGAYTRDLRRYTVRQATGGVELTEDLGVPYRYPDRTWGPSYGLASGVGLAGDPRASEVWASYLAGYTPDPAGADASAGAPVVPGDLALGVILTIAAIGNLTPDAGLYKSESQGDWSVTRSDDASPVPPAARVPLYRYRRKSI
jgi:hypothetical protein